MREPIKRIVEKILENWNDPEFPAYAAMAGVADALEGEEREEIYRLLESLPPDAYARKLAQERGQSLEEVMAGYKAALAQARQRRQRRLARLSWGVLEDLGDERGLSPSAVGLVAELARFLLPFLPGPTRLGPYVLLPLDEENWALARTEEVDDGA